MISLIFGTFLDHKTIKNKALRSDKTKSSPQTVPSWPMRLSSATSPGGFHLPCLKQSKTVGNWKWWEQTVTYRPIAILIICLCSYIFKPFPTNVTCITTWKHLSISFGGCCMGRFARNQRLLPFWIQERQSCGKSNAIIVILFGEGSIHIYWPLRMVYGCSMVLGLGWFTVVYHIRGSPWNPSFRKDEEHLAAVVRSDRPFGGAQHSYVQRCQRGSVSNEIQFETRMYQNISQLPLLFSALAEDLRIPSVLNPIVPRFCLRSYLPLMT